jgi:hypothetical protein
MPAVPLRKWRDGSSKEQSMKSSFVKIGALNMGGFFVNHLEKCEHCASFCRAMRVTYLL